jgi:hypothetical protein
VDLRPPARLPLLQRWYGRAGTAIDAELDLAYLGQQSLEQALKNAQQQANEVVDFGDAKNPFAFTVPKPPEKDLSKWGVA